jgi:hypothetical protein
LSLPVLDLSAKKDMIQGFGLAGGLMVKAKPIMPPPSLMVAT